MKLFEHKTLVGIALLVTVGSADALVVDFGSGVGATTTPSTPHVQNGMTMTPLDTGFTGGINHWDWFRNGTGATALDWHAGIHTGNNGEEVEFTFGGAAFDLLSIDIEGIILDGGAPTTETGTFTSSSGAITTTSSVGTVDFTGLAGFQNITSFTFAMPFGVDSCDSVDCITMMFDNVQFQEASVVPLPAAAWLFGSAVGLLGWKRRKAR